MPEKINWTIKAQVVGGPTITESKPLEVEAYGKIQITVTHGDPEKEVEVQPGGVDSVSFLLIKSDVYNDLEDDSANLTFKVNLSTNDEINLDAPIMLIGNGAIQNLDPGNAPQKLYFTNSLGTDDNGDGIEANIEILVGRDSTP